jgi:cysteine desulfurase
MRRSYLDWAAGAPIRPEVIAAMAEAMAHAGNPSSVHGAGRSARQRVEQARRQLADAVGMMPDDIVFTSGGTEASQLALAQAAGQPILVSAIEHASVLEAVPQAVWAPVTQDGALDLAALEHLLADLRPALVSIMLASNETGVIQPVAEAAALARAHGALVHVDAVQGLGKLRVAPEQLGADLVSVSAHKIGGPPGIGALLLRPGFVLAPRQVGGGQEQFRRGGTENLPGIMGFGVAAAMLEGIDWQAIAGLRDRLEAGLREASPTSVVAGSRVSRLPNLTSLVTPGLRAETQLMALDLDGIAVSAGAACSSGRVTASHVLQAMGFGLDAGCAIRISLGWSTTHDDALHLLEAWRRLQQRASARPGVAAEG